jgi:hypothetical protein
MGLECRKVACALTRVSGLWALVASLVGLLLGFDAALARASDLDSGDREILTPAGWEPPTPSCTAGNDPFASPELLTPDGWRDGRSLAQACWADSAYSELVVPAAWARGPRPARAF